MAIAHLIARIILALVFAVGGVTKLADLPGSRRGLEEFGLSRALAVPLGTLLPVLEVAVAAALIPVASAWCGALAALALLVVFTAGVAFTLLSGRRPDGHCFGQLYSAPIGWGTLARNAVMIALAAFVVWQGEAGASVVTLAENAVPAVGSLWLSAALAT